MGRPAAALLLLVALLAPLAAAQDTAPVLVERVGEDDLAATADDPARAAFRLFNLNPEDDFYVSVVVDAPPGWNAEVEPNRFFLAPRNATEVFVAFAPEGIPQTGAAFEVVFSLVHGRTGEVTKVVEAVVVESAAPPRVLGLFANPLGPPLDNAYGTFLLDAVFWAGVALFALFIGDAIVRSLTARASSAVTREIVLKLRRPVFLFVFFLGLSRSFAVLPDNAITEGIAKFLVALAVLFFGLYVLYRVLDAVLFYYQREIAPRTESQLDDVLVPVLRKIGIVILYVVGIVATLRRLGWDPTIVFAGAGIAGLVIAFAAQDTFSNLFSGLFLLLDRPFKEGDDIQLETGEIVRVENIGLRTTRLYFGKNHELITVPNNQLATRRVTNLAGPDLRYWVQVEVGASYGSDPARVREVLREVALAHPKVLREPGWEPLVLFLNFADSSLHFVLRAAVADYRDRVITATELRIAIKAAFDREGIEIPFPQRTLWIKEMPESGGRLAP